ncbi:DUF6531 domain-containing protein [Dactylosporangium sp. CA-233914]|uniref:DUF6531 domain-containing protein n=1 Tax=Dactylosporangium sp. CA-233914 TaxID=3239934 RepID=UPI003D8D7E4A
MALVLLVSMFVAMEVAAYIDALPDGATKDRPGQAPGSAAGQPHNVDSAATRTPGAAAASGNAPHVPGSVGPEARFADVALPLAKPAGNGDLKLSSALATSTGVVAGSVELTGERTARSTVYQNPDGTKTLRTYESDTFVALPDGTFQTLDPNLHARPDWRLAPKMAAAASFAPTASGTLATLDLGGARVGFGLAGAAAVKGKVNGDTVAYQSVRPFADIELSTSVAQVKEDLVLHGPQAPTSWLFPLQLSGVTAELDPDSGEVLFRDPAGKVRGAVPPGWMVDANIGPSGEGAVSTGVRYSLEEYGTGIALRVDLDAEWLSDPARKFPVRVDPTVRYGPTDDTFVSSHDYANTNNGSMDNLRVGTYNGGTEKSAAYLAFDTAMAALRPKYVLGASLNLYNYWSYSCQPRPVTVYPVLQTWGAATAKTWPGPSYAADRPLVTKSFAHGYTGCSSGAWESLQIPADRMTDILHWREAAWGFTVRASETDSYGWKRFNSGNNANASSRPFLDVNYADQGVSFQLLTNYFDPAVTVASGSTLKVRVTNQGSVTWTPGGPEALSYRIFNSAGQQVYIHPNISVPFNVSPGASYDQVLTVPAAPALGTYTMKIDMASAGGWMHDVFGSPSGDLTYAVANSAPTIKGNSPPNNGYVYALRPTLSVDYYDPDNTPNARSILFKICNGTPAAPVGCRDSGWTNANRWIVPDGVLSWGKSSFWYVTVSDTQLTSPQIGPFQLTPKVSQPAITSHLSTAPADADISGVDPQVGNYSGTVTDASVDVPGPQLAVVRTYNSQDPRRTGAFGSGWTTSLDQRLTTEPDGNVVVTLASGLTVRFGRNADGSYAAPEGRNLTLIRTAAAGSSPERWTLRDSAGARRGFDAGGRLTDVTDADGRVQTMTYDSSGKLVVVIDVTSGRKLMITWAADHVIAVAADPPAAGQPAPTWTYVYTGADLTQVCSPLSAQSCVSYEYTASSHYRSLVLDDGATGYWPLGEAEGAVAANAAARRAGEWDATYTYPSSVNRGLNGALAGSTDKAAGFANNTLPRVQLPNGVLSSARSFTIELWYSIQNAGPILWQANDEQAPDGSSGGAVLTALSDGSLRAGLRYIDGSGTVTRAQITSAPAGFPIWRHAVLTGTDSRQELYVDGAFVGAVDGPLVNFSPAGQLLVGGSPGTLAFTGKVDEVAYYQRPLSAAAIKAHYDARVQTSRLTKITEPGPFVAEQMAYDPASGRLTTLTDRNGTTWTLSAPTLAEDKAKVTITSTGRSAITYAYDPFRGNRLVERRTEDGTRQWQYNDAGFVSATVDENGHATTYDTDSRGNVVGVTTFRGGYHTKRFGYYLNAADPLDPRNDAMIWQADARSASETDTTYRTSYDLDSAGRVTGVTYPIPAGQSTHPVETFQYSVAGAPAEGGGTLPAGLLTGSAGRNDTWTYFYYNSKGDLVRTTTPGGLETRFTRDTLGRRKSEVSNPGWGEYATTTYTYTPTGLIATETRSGITDVTNTTLVHTRRTTNTYDALGRRTSAAVSDLTGGYATRTTTWGYDPAGRLTSTQDPTGAMTTQEWGLLGDVTKQTLPSGLVLEHVYNDDHQLAETAATGSGVNPADPVATRLVLEARAYDPAGRLATVTDAAGRQTTYKYADDDLLTEVWRARTPVSGGEGEAPPADLTLIGSRTYDNAGHATSVTDAGRTVATTYDAAGYVAQQTIPVSTPARVVQYTYNLDGTRHTAKIDSPSGVRMFLGYSYNAMGQLIQVLDYYAGYEYPSMGRPVEYYDRDPRGLVTMSSLDGVTTMYQYDAAGQLIQAEGLTVPVWTGGVSSLAKRTTTYTRNTFGEATAEVDAGLRTETTYDAAGRPTKVKLPAYTQPGTLTTLQPTVKLEYDPSGNLTTLTDPLNRVTTAGYDKYGRQVSVTQPDPDGTGPKTAPVTTTKYTVTGEESEVTDATGARRLTTWDAFGRMASVGAAERNGSSTLYYTTALGYEDSPYRPLPTTVTSPVGGVTKLAYTPAGEPSRITDPTGRFAEFAYDEAGRVVRQRQGLHSGTTDTYMTTVIAFAYDTMGRETATAMCATADDSTCLTTPYSKTTTTYNWDGFPQTQTSGEGRVTRFEYDNATRLTSVTQLKNAADEASAVTVQLGYDVHGRRTRVVDGNGNATDYTFNSLGLPESTVEPATAAHPGAADRTWTTVYDAAGQPVTRKLPGNVSRSRTFDALGRLTTETGTGAEAVTATRTLDYDADGRIVHMGGPTGDTTYTWNDRGLLTQSAGAAGNATFAYDGDGRMTSRTDVAGTSAMTYDGAGRILTATDPLTGTTQNFTYETVSGRLFKVQYGTGASEVYTYDSQDRQISTEAWRAPDGTVLRSIAYDRDRDGLLTYKRTGAQTTQNPGTTYAYDGLGRLTSATTGTAVDAYAYDDASNLVSSTVQGTTRTATYDQRNRLLSATSTGAAPGSETYSWSARGALATANVNGAASTYTFDAFERLIRAVTTGQTLDYTYDSLDRLAQRNTFNTVYDDLTNNAVEGATSGQEATLFRLPDGLVTSSKVGTGPGQALLTDRQHGDGIATADPATGTVTGTADYSPTGTRTATGATVPVGFQGGATDTGTGMTNAAARWYSPGLRGFASRDTMTLDPQPVSQINRYLYGNGAPTTNADRDGHNCNPCSPKPPDGPDRNPPGSGDDGGGNCAVSYGSNCSDDGSGPCYLLVRTGSTCSDEGNAAIGEAPKTPGGGGGGGGGGSKKKKSGKPKGHPKPPVPPRKPIGSEPNQRPSSVDLNGGHPIGNENTIVTPPTVTQCLDDCANGPNIVPAYVPTHDPSPSGCPGAGCPLNPDGRPNHNYCNFPGMDTFCQAIDSFWGLLDWFHTWAQRICKAICDILLVIFGAVMAEICALSGVCIFVFSVIIGLIAFGMCWLKDDPQDGWSEFGCVMAGILEGKGGEKVSEYGKRAIPLIKRVWEERKKLWPW